MALVGGRLQLLLCGLLTGAVLLTACGSPPSDAAIRELKAQVEQQYAGWQVESTYPRYSHGAEGGPSVVLVLKWPGPEDFRLRLYYFGEDPSSNRPWAPLFLNRQDAIDFIQAFKARHPEPGWVVNMHDEGGTVTVAFESVDEVSNDAGFWNARREEWRGTRIGGGSGRPRLSWTYLGPGHR